MNSIKISDLGGRSFIVYMDFRLFTISQLPGRSRVSCGPHNRMEQQRLKLFTSAAESRLAPKTRPDQERLSPLYRDSNVYLRSEL